MLSPFFWTKKNYFGNLISFQCNPLNIPRPPYYVEEQTDKDRYYKNWVHNALPYPESLQNHQQLSFTCIFCSVQSSLGHLGLEESGENHVGKMRGDVCGSTESEVGIQKWWTPYCKYVSFAPSPVPPPRLPEIGKPLRTEVMHHQGNA